MTSSRIEHLPLDAVSVAGWAQSDPQHVNWPVVYTLDGDRHVYVGETTQFPARMRQHLARPDRRNLTSVRVVIDETFNKSVCLDLESFLIGRFAGDGKFEVDNANAGLASSNYFDRDRYREQFVSIFEQLREDGLFDQTLPQIENSDLFKLSPYKTLNYDQRIAILGVLEQLLADLRGETTSTSVIDGQPGTGKTIVGIYLMKLLSDIRRLPSLPEADTDALFAGFFTPENAELLRDVRMALVVPQQSLRRTVANVFAKTSGLSRDMVLSPLDVGASTEPWDVLVVEEAHRLQQFSATIGPMIKKFRDVNARLFDGDEVNGNQVDWIRRLSAHQVFLLDAHQTVKPADVPAHVVAALESEARVSGHLYVLASQMRLRAGEDYVGYVRAMLSAAPPAPQRFAEYDFRMFDDLGEMRRAVAARDAESGLSRLVAGYAWKWVSKNDPAQPDIVIDGEHLQWNTTAVDWISSPTSAREVGSIHTTQGYDLNVAGVIIGPDLRYDPEARRLFVDRSSYFDTKGKQNNKVLGITYSDDDLLRYITNIYAVLLTRGILGTYVYVCDPSLREYLAQFIPSAKALGLADTMDATTTSVEVQRPSPVADLDRRR